MVFFTGLTGFLGINVPRSRFLPVKKTSDLLLVMSNLFNLQNGTLIMNPARVYPSLPLVKLGDPDFTKVIGYLIFGPLLNLFSLLVVGLSNALQSVAKTLP